MKKSKFTPIRIIDGYIMKHQQSGGYKIIEYSHVPNEKGVRKRTIFKKLDMSTAETKLYELENKQK